MYTALLTTHETCMYFYATAVHDSFNYLQSFSFVTVEIIQREREGTTPPPAPSTHTDMNIRVQLKMGCRWPCNEAGIHGSGAAAIASFPSSPTPTKDKQTLRIQCTTRYC